MADLFISYKREDRRVAERLSIALEQLGFDVWWDFELLSGDGFRKIIERVIDECSTTIVLWSELSRESTFVVDEATYSREQDKLCPARIDDCRLPLGFGGDHVVDLRGWEGEMSHDGLQGLIRAVEAKTGKKARLGAKPRGQDEEAHFAEMEAFKAAEAAGNVSALQSFLRDFPRGSFANFVRGQLETMGAEAPKVTVAAYSSGASAPSRSAPAHGNPASLRRPTLQPNAPEKERRMTPWFAIAGVLAAAAVAAVVFVILPRGSTTVTAPTSVLAQAKPDGASAAYDANTLNEQVRAAVEQARRSETLATSAATRARSYAQLAEQNIGHEPSGMDVRVFSGGNAGDRYAGQIEAMGVGYGSQAQAVRYQGLGIYAWGQNANNTFGGLRYEGEFANDAANGAGLYFWRDGKHYAGAIGNWRRDGLGVFTFADGRRYEGQWSGDQQSGLGAEWDAQGRVAQQGVWSGGVLTTPLT
jgi:hypothetical protein